MIKIVYIYTVHFRQDNTEIRLEYEVKETKTPKGEISRFSELSRSSHTTRAVDWAPPSLLASLLRPLYRYRRRQTGARKSSYSTYSIRLLPQARQSSKQVLCMITDSILRCRSPKIDYIGIIPECDNPTVREIATKETGWPRCLCFRMPPRASRGACQAMDEDDTIKTKVDQ